MNEGGTQNIPRFSRNIKLSCETYRLKFAGEGNNPALRREYDWIWIRLDITTNTSPTTGWSSAQFKTTTFIDGEWWVVVGPGLRIMEVVELVVYSCADLVKICTGSDGTTE